MVMYLDETGLDINRDLNIEMNNLKKKYYEEVERWTPLSEKRDNPDIMWKSISSCTREIYLKYFLKHGINVDSDLILAASFLIAIRYVASIDREDIVQLFSLSTVRSIFGAEYKRHFTKDQLEEMMFKVLEATGYEGCKHKVREELGMEDERLEDILPLCKNKVNPSSYGDLIVVYLGKETFACFTSVDWNNEIKKVLPAGWRIGFSKSQQKFYYVNPNGESQWEEPLPKQWVEEYGEKGVVWKNTKTGEINKWDPPTLTEAAVRSLKDSWLQEKE